MFEILMGIFAMTAMGKLANALDLSVWAWVGITFAIIVGSIIFLPWPMLRILIALVVAFVLIFVAKARE